MPPGWTPPPGVEGDAPLLRAYVSAARPGERSCPQYRAVKARPNVADSLRQSGKRRGLEMFGLQALNNLLDLIEFEDLSVDQALRRLRSPGYGRPPHPALARWAAGVATRWLAVGRDLRDSDGLVLAPAAREWVVQWRPPSGAADQVIHEVCAWGRRPTFTCVSCGYRERVRSRAGRPTTPREVLPHSCWLGAARSCGARHGSPSRICCVLPTRCSGFAWWKWGARTAHITCCSTIPPMKRWPYITNSRGVRYANRLTVGSTGLAMTVRTARWSLYARLS